MPPRVACSQPEFWQDPDGLNIVLLPRYICRGYSGVSRVVSAAVFGSFDQVTQYTSEYEKVTGELNDIKKTYFKNKRQEQRMQMSGTDMVCLGCILLHTAKRFPEFGCVQWSGVLIDFKAVRASQQSVLLSHVGSRCQRQQFHVKRLNLPSVFCWWSQR